MRIIKIVSKQELKQITYLIIDRNTNLLIDCGAPYSQINRRYKTLLKTKKDLKIDAILLTHIHFDHISGIESVQEKTNCKVYVEDGSIKSINNPIWQCGVPFGKIYTFTPNNLFGIKDGEILTFGDLSVKVLSTPGHAPSCVCYKICNKLFTGDTLFLNSYGRTDLIGGNATQLKTSLKKIKSLSQHMCYPGHGINFHLFDE